MVGKKGPFGGFCNYGIFGIWGKDPGTGKEQKITITSSSNLSESEIEKAVKEAEEFAAQDKKAKEQVEIKNNAEAAVYQAEKLVADMGDKLESSDKSDVEAAVSQVKDAIAANDTDLMKEKTDALTKVFYGISEKIYKSNPEAFLSLIHI